MPRRERRTERVALVVAIVVAAASGALLLLTDDDNSRSSDAGPATTTTSRPSTTVSLAPGCDVFEEQRDTQEASGYVQLLLTHLIDEPDDPAALARTVDALDSFTETELPRIADGLGELASDISEYRDGALLLRTFVVEVVRALDASDSAEGMIAVLVRAFTREETGAAMVAIQEFIRYNLDNCPQPLG